MKTISVLPVVAALFITSSSVAMADDKIVLPNYVAVDYNVSGQHPPLTPAQLTRIQQILARVKPCQRPLVHYAVYPYEGMQAGLVFFFRTPNDDVLDYSHVFGDSGRYYMPTDGLFSGFTDDTSTQEAQAKQGIQWDIDRQPCPK